MSEEEAGRDVGGVGGGGVVWWGVRGTEKERDLKGIL